MGTGLHPSKKLLQMSRGLYLGYCDSTLWANFNTGFAPKAFIHIYGLRLAINHLIYCRRASIYTFFVSDALIFINYDFPHGKPPLILI
jgi:hypothetical protein